MAFRYAEAKMNLAESFVELAEDVPIDHITINMIVDQIGKHRKTFYYHFGNKEQLITWLFRYELGVALEQLFPPDILIYEQDANPLSIFPFYVRNIGEEDRIYNARFFDALYGCFEQRRRYYRNVFSKLGPGTLEHYLLSLYKPAIEDDIRYLLDRELGRQNILVQGSAKQALDNACSTDFLAEFFTGAFVSRFIQRLNYASVGRTISEISPYENVIHDSLGWLVHQQVCRMVGNQKANMDSNTSCTLTTPLPGPSTL